MRGEDPAAPLLMTVAEGSPPHARGRHMVAIVHYANRRITPACAGKTWRCWVLGWRPWDHPRMRGEDFGFVVVFCFVLGSPPHARGRLLRQLRQKLIRRITPACAGKTRIRRDSRPRSSDHPRMRGEDVVQFHELDGSGGSPPHARGRPALLFRRFPDFGITPACAGKTQSAPSARSATPDHPRMRGEDFTPKSRALYVWGSPPHARGRLHPKIAGVVCLGITPACAGKTHRKSSS